MFKSFVIAALAGVTLAAEVDAEQYSRTSSSNNNSHEDKW